MSRPGAATLLAATIALGAAALPAPAQEREPDDPIDDDGTDPQPEEGEAGVPEPGVCTSCGPDRHMTAAIQLASIEQLSAIGGYYLDFDDRGAGWWFTAAAGLGGGELGAGRAVFGGGCVPVGGGVRLVWLRTWGHPWHADPNESYVGVKVSGGAIPRFELGALKRVDDDGDGDRGDWRVTWGIGVGW